MSAEILGRAASLMRERARSATGGKWSDGGIWWEHWTDAEGRRCHTPWPTITTGALGSEIVGKVTTEGDAAYFASWHPAVALAVADWLEESAEHLEVHEDKDIPGDLRPNICPTALEGPDCSVLGQALAVARAYLGDQS